MERRILDRMFGTDRLPEIMGHLRLIMIGQDHPGFNVEQLADQLLERLVEINEEIVFPLEEGGEIVGIILEEGAHVVGRDQGVPMEMPPIAVIGDPYVAGEALQRLAFLDRDGERQGAVGGGDDAAVAISLLREILAGLQADRVVAQEFGVILYRSEISGGKIDLRHDVFLFYDLLMYRFEKMSFVFAVPAEDNVADHVVGRDKTQVARVDRLVRVVR